jgi:hypothetical protein
MPFLKLTLADDLNSLYGTPCFLARSISATITMLVPPSHRWRSPPTPLSSPLVSFKLSCIFWCLVCEHRQDKKNCSLFPIHNQSSILQQRHCAIFERLAFANAKLMHQLLNLSGKKNATHDFNDVISISPIQNASWCCVFPLQTMWPDIYIFLPYAQMIYLLELQFRCPVLSPCWGKKFVSCGPASSFLYQANFMTICSYLQSHIFSLSS